MLFDAGDVFQGTPYFNVFEGELEFKLMSMLKYDAMTIGNHDFDNGISGLKKQIYHATFDFICSNYDFSNTILEGKTASYKTYKKSKRKRPSSAYARPVAVKNNYSKNKKVDKISYYISSYKSI